MRKLLVCLIAGFALSISAQETKTHIIQRGETIESIAKKYGISEADLKEANPDIKKFYYAGMSIVIPVKAVAVESKSVGSQPYQKRQKVNTAKSNPSYRLETKMNNLPEKKHAKQNTGISFGFLVDVYGGYSTFKWSGGTPKAGIGFGGGLSGRVFWKGTTNPEGYFAEIGIGYSRKGTGAFPMDYVGARVFPLSYSLGENSFFIKAGGYIGYPLSKIKTSHNSYDGNLDYGVDVGVGMFFLDHFSVMLSLEEGFAKICDSPVDLNNRNIFLTLSYRIK